MDQERKSRADIQPPIRLALLGQGIAHSRSPEFVGSLLRERGVKGEYVLAETDRAGLERQVRQLAGEGFRGANVTSPYKEEIVAYLDDLDAIARRLGAVNTIRFFDDGRSLGTNTDVIGFARSLDRLDLLASPFSAVVAGTGGAARAAVEVLLRYDNLEELSLLSRDRSRADEELKRWDDGRMRAATYDEPLPVADLLVHATPVGLPARPGALFSTSDLSRFSHLYEMIYRPDPTELMRRASEAGIKVIGGTLMFEEQARAAVDFWLAPTPADR